jgi:hypothetical protein
MRNDYWDYTDPKAGVLRNLRHLYECASFDSPGFSQDNIHVTADGF